VGNFLRHSVVLVCAQFIIVCRWANCDIQRN